MTKKHYLCQKEVDYLRENIAHQIVEWMFLNEEAHNTNHSGYRKDLIAQIRIIVNRCLKEHTKTK